MYRNEPPDPVAVPVPFVRFVFGVRVELVGYPRLDVVPLNDAVEAA